MVVENIRCRRPLLELEVFGDLIDRALEAGRVDAADAVAPDFAGQDIVAQDRVQAFQFEIARRTAIHPAHDFGQARSGSLMARCKPPITARTNAFTASGLAAANAGLTIRAKP